MKNNPVRILSGATVYSPSCLGIMDVLIVNDKIAAVGKNLRQGSGSLNPEIVNLKGRYLIPGLIDQHVHISGGGGESGFASRISPVETATLASGGVTTVVGLLGTDGTTRTIADLYGCARKLEQSGISSYILTGSYEYPSVTLTGSVRKDILFVDKIIGVKTAISDHRASSMTYKELANLATSARVAGMLGGKAGIVTIHVGDARSRLDILFETLEKTEIPVRHFMPTHLNRNRDLMEDALKFGRMGGYLDFTAVPLKNKPSSEISAGEAVGYMLDRGVAEDRLIMSSDGNGSWSEYDEKGQVVKIGVSDPHNLFNELRSLLVKGDVPVEKAIRTVTENPAKALSIHPQKGIIAPGSDADIVVLGRNFSIESVFAKGRRIS